MTAAPTVALCVLTHNRPDELRAALASAQGFDEVIVIDNASDQPLGELPGVRLIRSETNTGVTGGRNLLARAATADVLLYLDDDAVLRTPNAAEFIRAMFDADARLAAVAARIVRSDGHIERMEFPFRGPVRDPDTPRACAYFLGGAAAVRREAFLAAGGYDETFFYSTEETDLGFKFIAAGLHIRYEPGLEVEHRPSVHGRSLAPAVPALYLRNRLQLVRRHLPTPLAFAHIAIWGVHTFRLARRSGGMREWRSAWREGMRAPVHRSPLRWRQLLDVHRWGGRVLW